MTEEVPSVPTVRLTRAGFAPEDLPGRAELLDHAARALRQATGAPPEWVWFVPGRVEVFGKHTDYAGGASLVAAVPRGFAVAASPRPDACLSVVDARWSTRVDIDLNDRGSLRRGWAGYVDVVARRFARNFPGAPLGVDMAIASDLPRAAGLSSSSALVVGVALALVRRGVLGARPEWRAAIRSPLDLAGYLGAVEAGRGFATLDAGSGVGTQGGSEDHTAILASTADRLRMFSYVPVQPIGEAVLPASWQFVIMTSGVHADKAGRVRGQYNRAAEAVHAIVEAWRDEGGEGETLASVVAQPGGEARLRRIIARTMPAGFSPRDLEARLSHFVAEHGRVGQALEAFRAADRALLGRLSDQSQADAERLLGNQVPETIALARTAREAGAFAASSFGAGFGGSVWALVDREDTTAFAGEWLARYRELSRTGGRIEWFTARPGPAAFEVDDRPDGSGAFPVP